MSVLNAEKLVLKQAASVVVLAVAVAVVLAVEEVPAVLADAKADARRYPDLARFLDAVSDGKPTR